MDEVGRTKGSRLGSETGSGQLLPKYSHCSMAERSLKGTLKVVSCRVRKPNTAQGRVERDGGSTTDFLLGLKLKG